VPRRTFGPKRYEVTGDWIKLHNVELHNLYKYHVFGHYPSSYLYLNTVLFIGTSSIDWAQLSRFYLKTETESSLRNVVF
jgi:hypothetical protein